MLTDLQIEDNKQEVFTLLRSIKTRENANIEELIDFLNNSDFGIAPASSRYHSNFKGGLVHHLLCVYKRLKTLAGDHYNDATIIITAICHDLDKVNHFEQYVRNVQNPNDSSWRKVPGWKKRDPQNRVIFGTHGQNSLLLTESFIRLDLEESTAILNHMAGMEAGLPADNIVSEVMSKYPLAVYLHVADFMATHLDEEVEQQD